MIESVLFHDVSVKGPRPVIFQNVPLIVPHMQNNCQIKHISSTVTHAVGDVLRPVCPSTGVNIYFSLPKKKSMKMLSGEVSIDVGASVVITHWHHL